MVRGIPVQIDKAVAQYILDPDTIYRTERRANRRRGRLTEETRSVSCDKIFHFFLVPVVETALVLPRRSVRSSHQARAIAAPAIITITTLFAAAYPNSPELA
jgi:hypothetical protein